MKRFNPRRIQHGSLYLTSFLRVLGTVSLNKCFNRDALSGIVSVDRSHAVGVNSPYCEERSANCRMVGEGGAERSCCLRSLLNCQGCVILIRSYDPDQCTIAPHIECSMCGYVRKYKDKARYNCLELDPTRSLVLPPPLVTYCDFSCRVLKEDQHSL